ncbi:hypothetical protein BDV19DRAFT_381782 [Aspergillus venezuelensis]
MSLPTDNPAEYNPTFAAWGVGWQSPTIMLGLAICGALLSLGHHLYYRRLDNTLVTSTDQQTWAIRIGTGLAFLVKTSLVSAVGIAAAQQIWATLRQRSMKLRGIDGMLIPLTAVITPATLSVCLLTTNNVTELRVPIVEFAVDSFWLPWVTYGPTGQISTPSPAIMRLLTTTASSMDDTQFSNVTEIDYCWYRAVQSPNSMIFVYAKGRNSLWDEGRDETTKLVCQLWNTSYVTQLNYTNGARTLTPMTTELIAPSNWSTREGQAATLEDAETDVVNGGYYVTHLLFSSVLGHEFWSTESGILLSNPPTNGGYLTLSPMETDLLDCAGLWNNSDYKTIIGDDGRTTTAANCRNGTLAAAIADLSRNFTYSLLSLNASSAPLPVTVSSAQNFYRYHSRNLLAAYVSALGVTLACVAVGLVALYNNGVSQSTSFSSVLLTTRNPELDRLAVGHCLGSDSWDRDTEDARLRFGELNDGARDYRHAAFGMKGSVTALSREADYY